MSGDVEDGALDMAWKSDLKDVGGETVAGTTEDDLGNQTTDWLPECVDKDEDELSENEYNVIRAWVTHPDEKPSFSSVSDSAGVSYQTVRRILRRNSILNPGYSELNSTEQAVIDASRSNPDASHTDIAEKVGCSSSHVGQIRAQHNHLLKRENKELLSEQLEDYPKEKYNCECGESFGSKSALGGHLPHCDARSKDETTEETDDGTTEPIEQKTPSVESNNSYLPVIGIIAILTGVFIVIRWFVRRLRGGQR
jgi:hypothetical protein